MFDPISDFWDPHPDPHCRVVSEPAHQSYNNLINPSICRQLFRLISTCHRLPVFTTGGSHSHKTLKNDDTGPCGGSRLLRTNNQKATHESYLYKFINVTAIDH